eukprot:scaffold3857_cov127-Cylindrotheca_fusiformis.AAC.13
MNGDLLGDMAFATPMNEKDSPQVQPASPPAMMSFDLLSGSPVMTREGQSSDATNLLDMPVDSVSQNSVSSCPDNATRPQEAAPPVDLFDGASSAPAAADPFSAPYSDAPSTLPSSSQPSNAHPDPFASFDDQLIPFHDHQTTSTESPDPFLEQPIKNEDPFAAFSEPSAESLESRSAASKDSMDLLGGSTTLQSQHQTSGEDVEADNDETITPDESGLNKSSDAPSSEKNSQTEEINESTKAEDGEADNDETITPDESALNEIPSGATKSPDAPMDKPSNSTVNDATVDSSDQSDGIQEENTSAESGKESTKVEDDQDEKDETITPDVSAKEETQSVAIESPEASMDNLSNIAANEDRKLVEAQPVPEDAVETERLAFDEEKKVDQITEEKGLSGNGMEKATNEEMPTAGVEQAEKAPSPPQEDQDHVSPTLDAASSSEDSTKVKQEDGTDDATKENSSEAEDTVADIPNAQSMENPIEKEKEDDSPLDVVNESATPTPDDLVGDKNEVLRMDPDLNSTPAESTEMSKEPTSIIGDVDNSSQAVSDGIAGTAPATDTPEMVGNRRKEKPHEAVHQTIESSSPQPSDEIETSSVPLENPSEKSQYIEQIDSLEKELQAAREAITQLRQQQEERQLKDQIVDDLQQKLQKEMGKRAEAEDDSRRAKAKAEQLAEEFSTLRLESEEQIGQLRAKIEALTTSENKMQEEMVVIREERDEQARRLSSYTTRLNEAKKNEAVKVNAADHYESKVDDLNAQLKETRDEMAQIKFERDRYKKELGNWKKYAEQRTTQLEGQLQREKKLNDERKRKMRFFVESKTEEVRSTKAENVSLQDELDQTTRSLKDFNQRYKQLHSQWVQSQTRNRELQRDVAKTKNDSEKMSKVGGTLEAKLLRSASEIEDHKNKRMAAKNELMAVIAQLEAEKKASNRLKEYVKSTFTPKVQSQQQMLQEKLEHFDAGLKQLATRFGRELPTTRKRNGQPNADSETSPKTTNATVGIQSKISDASTVRILTKLEEETQRVNQHIAKVSTNVDQLQNLLVAPSTKGCVGAMFKF